jgi:peroxiredoxin Q/BCP
MKRLLTLLSIGLAAIALPVLAATAIGVGDKAPDFTAQASLAGKEFTFNLADALKKGPVVVYFYPEAFTKGCTIEAHEFADASDKYAALGASVIGVSHDHIDKLDQFSVQECRNKFAVAADPDLKVINAYGAAIPGHETYANRTSYVITPDGKVIYMFSAMDPSEHVNNTLKAISDWKAKNGK